MRHVTTIALAAALTLTALAASAAVTSVSLNVPLGQGRPDMPFQSDAATVNAQGTSHGVSSPWHFTAFRDSGYFNAVHASGFTDYHLADDRTDLRLLWGTPSDGDVIRFLDAEGAEVWRITGAQVLAEARDLIAPAMVNVHLSQLPPYREMRFESASGTFEYALLQQTFPTATAGLLVLGLGGLGVLTYRRLDQVWTDLTAPTPRPTAPSC